MPHATREARRDYERQYWASRLDQRRRLRYFQDKARHANQRAELAGVPGRITTADVRAILAPGQCAHCGVEGDQLELDHVIPMAKGGPNDPLNIVPSCGACNRSKQAAPTPWRWSRAHDACLGCGTTERKHTARGFCNACYLERFGAKDRWRTPAEREGVPAPDR